MQNGQGAGNSMLKDRLAECPNRTNWCVRIQRNKRTPVCWAVMDEERIVERSYKSRVTMWF